MSELEPLLQPFAGYKVTSEKMSHFLSEGDISQGETGPISGGMKGCPALSKPELNLALRHLRGRYRWRNRALLILGVRTGMRISELLSLRVGQVYDGRRVLTRL